MFLRPQATGCPAPRRMVAHRYRCFSGAFGRLSVGYAGGREGGSPSKDAENPPARSHNRTGGLISTLEPLVQEQRSTIRLSLSLRSQQAPPPSTHREARPHGAEESVRAGPLSIPKSSAYSRYAYRHEAEQPPPAAGYREQTIIRSTRSRQRNQ